MLQQLGDEGLAFLQADGVLGADHQDAVCQALRREDGCQGRVALAEPLLGALHGQGGGRYFQEAAALQGVADEGAQAFDGPESTPARE